MNGLHQHSDLKRKAISGLVWSFADRVGSQGAKYVISIILARLLLPEEYGLLAMVTVFTAFAPLFVESGFGQALIQKKDPAQIDYCSVFYLSIGLSVLFAGAICLAAPWIARFYKQPLLTALIRFMSISVVMGALRLIPINLFTKTMDFRTQAKISLLATILAGSTAILMAYRGFGVWSLALQYIMGDILMTLMAWKVHPWRPSLSFSWRALRVMFAFGSKLLASGFIDTLFNNMYLLVIGRLFPPAQLGYYTRAQQLQQQPNDTITVIVTRVTFPMMSSIQDDKALLKKCVRKSLLSLAMLNFPLMIGMALVARPLILLLLTAKWSPCISYLQWLCVAGAIYPLHAVHINVLLAQCRSDLFLKMECLKKCLLMVALLVTFRHGVQAMIVGLVAYYFLVYGLSGFYTPRLLNYPWRDQMLDLLPFVGITLAMVGAVLLVSRVPFPNDITRLTFEVATGAGTYIVLCRLLRLDAFMESLDILSGWTKKAVFYISGYAGAR